MIALKPRPVLLFATALLFASSSALWAQTTHSVTVGNNFFSPANLTIQVGDTVEWTNASGRTHDVTADDFSWASTTSSSFTFSRTFNSVEEILYHCTVHAVPGGSGMNGSISVVDDSASDFQINAGLNDSWFNPATLGQGFFITVFPDISSIFLAWFTYDTERPDGSVTANLGEPGHRWLTAFGEYSGNSATLDIELTQGGVFDSAEPPVQQSTDGTIVVEFSGCNEGMITYDIASANVQGIIPIERIATDNVPGCEALATQ